MSNALAGRFVLVTGATSGIGAATAQALAQAGASVVATGRNAAALEALASHGVQTRAGDLVDRAFVATLAAEAGACDVLVANAGILKHAPFMASRYEDWRAVFDMNVLATLDLIQQVAARMAARRRGHIVLVTSLLARRVARNTLVYAASKHALAAVAAGLRLELEPLGIRVTEIAPGLVRTGIFHGITHAEPRAAYAALDFDFLQPEDVAAAICNALTVPPGVCPDLIELRPLGQP